MHRVYFGGGKLIREGSLSLASPLAVGADGVGAAEIPDIVGLQSIKRKNVVNCSPHLPF